MSKSPKNKADVIERLLNKLCVELGFCLPPAENRRLIDNPPADAEAFAEAVFRAEGMDPRMQRGLYRQVRAVVVERFPNSDT